MADKTIGRVSVKVTPDTSTFRDDAKAKLDSEEKRLPELNVQLTLTIPKDQTAKVTAQAARITRTVQAAMNDLTLKVNVDDQASVQAALANIEREITRLGELEIPVGLNEADLNAAKALLQERLRDIGATITVDLADDGSIERAIAQIDAEMSKLKEVQIPVGLNEHDLLAAKELLQEQLRNNAPVEIKPELNDARVGLVSAALALLTRARKVEINPVVSKAGLAGFNIVSILSGFRALTDSIEEAHNAFSLLFTEMPQIMAIVPGVLALAGGFLSAAANVVGLAGNLAQALPILLAIPGIAIGIGTMVVALKDFGTVLPGVVSQLKALAPLISNAFWAQAKVPINDLATVVFPQLQTGLKGTATALGGFFAGLSSAIQAAISGGVLQAWFASLNESIKIFTGFAPVLAQIFQIFGNIGSALLPPLAQVMGELATQFAAFMNNLVAGAGGIGGFVTQTIAAFQGIINFVLSLGNVFAAVFGAASAAGAATFQSLADHINAFADTLRSPEIQQLLTGLFGAAFQLFDQFFAAAGPALQAFITGLGGVLTTVLPQVGTVLGQVATAFGAIFNNQNALNGLQSFIEGILTGVSALVPALAPVGDLIGALGPTLGTLATIIGKVFGALAPTLTGVITALQPVIDLLGNGLVDIITAVSPAIQQLHDALASALGNPAFKAAITAVVNALLALAPALSPLITLAANLVTSLMPVVAAILTPLAGLITQIVPLLSPLGDAISQIVAAVAPLIPMLIDLVLQVVTPLLPILVQLVTAVLPILVIPIQILADLLKILLPILSLLLTALIPPLADVLKVLADVITTVLNVAFGLMEKAINSAAGWIDKFTAQIGDFHAFWNSVWRDIGQFFEEIWNAIVGFVKDHWNQIVGFVTGGLDNMRATFTNGLNAITGLVSSAWDNVVSFFTGGIDNAVSTLTSLPGKALAALGNIGSTLLQAGKDLIQGFINGITSMASHIIDAIKHSITDVLPGFVKDALGIHSPSRVFADIGSNLMKGLAGGIEDEATTVMRALKGVVQDVAGVAFPMPTASLGVNAGSFNGSSAAATAGNTIIYNAAPGSSLGAEEDLFGALGRARAFGF